MKFYIVIALAVIATAASAQKLNLTDEQRDHVREVATECREKEGVSAEAVKELRSGQFDNVDEKVQCFTNCFLERIGLIENGVVKADVILAKLGPLVGEDTVKAIAEKCDSLKGANNCETATQIYKCYYENHAEL